MASNASFESGAAIGRVLFAASLAAVPSKLTIVFPGSGFIACSRASAPVPRTVAPIATAPVTGLTWAGAAAVAAVAPAAITPACRLVAVAPAAMASLVCWVNDAPCWAPTPEMQLMSPLAHVAVATGGAVFVVTGRFSCESLAM